MKKEVFEKSIVLSGPAGAGKSLLAEELSKKTGYNVISTDLLVDFPTKEELIEKMQKHVSGKKALQTMRERLLSEVLKDQNIKGVEHFYKKLGYSPIISEQMDKMYGALGWHYYQKYYETELLKFIVSQLKKPVILDLGSGMTICMENQYEEIKKDLIGKDPNFFKMAFPHDDKINLHNIQKVLKDFRNIVYLKLPDDYKEKMIMAAGDIMNKYFLESKQYELLKHFTIDVDGLVEGMSRKRDRAKELTKEIVNQIKDREEILSKA